MLLIIIIYIYTVVGITVVLIPITNCPARSVNTAAGITVVLIPITN